MSNASMPPTRKKKSAVPPYSRPIRLWSTVVIHERHPVSPIGRENTPRASTGVTTFARSSSIRGSSVIAIDAPLREGGQVVDEAVDLGLGQAEGGHAAALVGRHRHQSFGVAQPGLEVAPVEALDRRAGGTGRRDVAVRR